MRPLDPTVRAHLRPARRSLAVVLAAGGFQALLLVAQAFIVAGAVVAMVDRSGLRGWVIALLVVTVLRAATSFTGDSAATRAAATVRADLRQRLLSAVVLRHTGRPGVARGELVVLATRGVQETEPYLTRYLPALVLAVVLPPLSILAIATQDLLSALIVVLTVPLLPVFAALVGWRTRDRAARQWRQLAQLAGHFLDVMKGLPTLVAFRRADHQTQTIRRITHRYRLATMATLRLAFASSAILELVATISVALVAVGIGLRLANGSLDLRTGLTVLLLAPEAYWPIRRVGAEFHAAAQGTATFAEVDRLLAAGAQPEPAAALAREGLRTPAPMDITLEAVSVRYAGAFSLGLRETTAELRGPGLVAVTGPSGAGKTTLLNALRGRLEVSSGQLHAGGVPISALDHDWWAAQIAWSPQRPFFVHGTIADNLRLGRPQASDADLWAALHLVGLATIVSALPQGLDAALDEDGLSLSAGERARLALARVVVANRPIVLLDEPTAHLDVESERLVVATVTTLAQRSLVVVVTHRPALAHAAKAMIHLPGRSPRASDRTDASTGQQVLPPVAVAAAAAPVAERDPDAVPADPESPNPRQTRFLVAVSVIAGALAAGAGVALTATAGWLIVKASTQPAVLLLLVAIVAVRTFGIARPALRYVERILSHDAALRMLAEKRAEVYAALVPLTPGRLGRRRGDVLTSVVDDVEAVVDRRLRVWMPLSSMVLAGCITVAVTFFLLPMAALVDSALLVVAGGAVYALVRYRATRSDRTWVQERAVLGEDVTEVVEGADDLRAWGAAEDRLARVDRRSRHVEQLFAKSVRRAAEGRAVGLVAVGATVALSLVLAADAYTSGRISAPLGALLVMLPLAMAELVLPAADAAVADVQTRRSLGRLERLVTQKPAVVEADATVPLTAGAQPLDVRHVTAGWGATPAFHGLDLQLPPAGRIGVVGPSGSGKSTLAALLVRFLDPVEGSIAYAGTDLRSASFDDVRRTVGLLDDDPHVFASTIVENVRLARPGAGDSDVLTAIQAAALGPWIGELPDGMHTWVGEGHREVSAGERARLGLARIILAGQPVVVLDEPTAHLDADTAATVMTTLIEGAGGRGVVLITHRSEGLELMDRIVSLSAPSAARADTGGLAPDVTGTFSPASSS